MDPVIIRVKPDMRLAAVGAAALLGAALILVGLILPGIVVAIAAAVGIYLIGRRAVIAHDDNIIVRDFFKTEKYRWSRVAGFGTTQAGSVTIGVLNLLNGDEVLLTMWTDPEADIVQRLNAEAKRRHQER